MRSDLHTELVNYFTNNRRGLHKFYVRNKIEIDQLLTHIANYKEKLYLLANSIDVPLCICGNPRTFHRYEEGYHSTCGNKECQKQVKINHAKETMLDKYGVENVMQLQEFKDKVIQSGIDRYGEVQNLSSQSHRDRMKANLLEKYGVESPLQNAEIAKKREDTMFERHGTNSGFNVGNFSQTMQLLYGATSTMYVEEFKNRCVTSAKENKLNKLIEKINNSNKTYNGIDIATERILLLCNVCNSTYSQNRNALNAKLRNNIDSCPKCNYKYSFRSKGENEVYQWLRSQTNLPIETNYRFEHKYEADIYIPSLRLVIEYNGLYWHSEEYKSETYHQDKSLYFQSIGINCIMIWEDDWILKQDIVKSILLSKLNLTSKVFARNTIVKEITANEAKEFLTVNHLDGYVNAKYNYGLVFNNELVSVISFSKPRFNKEYNFEIIRFANRLNTTVIGGFSKLFQHFIRSNPNKSIMSYKKLDLGNTEFYTKCGFVQLLITPPNYFYLVDGIRMNRSHFQKKKLKTELSEREYMAMLGFVRIYDCGSMKFVFNKSDI